MASLVDLSGDLRAVGAPQSLLFAHVNFGAYQGTARPALGTPTPKVARETYTRQARREQRLRQLARRSGEERFLASLRSN